MISRVLRNKKAIRRILGNDKKTSHLVPSWQDLEILECLNATLAPLKEFTNILSGSKYVTISAVKPILHLLSVVELACKEDDLLLTCELKEEILQRLKARYDENDLSRLLNVATFLDPRYKADFIATSGDEANDTETSQLVLIKEELLQQAVFLNRAEQEDGASPSHSDTSQTPPAPKKAKLSLGALTSLRKPPQTKPAQSPHDRLSKEIQGYQTHPVIDADEDPLKWWQRSEVEFPMLCQLARKYLSIQASSSPSERLFSKAGLISTPSRAQLKRQKVDMLTFLAENL